MNILVLSNFYPPHYLGGYELGCRDVVEGLRNRQHRVVLLTSRHGSRVSGEDRVYRTLHSAYDWQPRFGWRHASRLLHREIVDCRAFQSVVMRHAPDIVYVWNLWSLPLSLLAAAHQSGKPVVHFVSDMHMTRWDSDPWYRLLDATPPLKWKRALVQKAAATAAHFGWLTSARCADLANAHFASEYLRDAYIGMGFRLQRAEVIHWGVADAWFGTTPPHNGPLRLLYAGRVSREKGIETAIEALGHVTRWSPEARATLTIVGGSGPADYEEDLRNLVAKLGLGDRVSFVRKLDRISMRDMYARHNVFVLPSVWQEPFSIALLEAMASGLVPVGTLTGGTCEILRAEVTGLVFGPGDAQACASQLRRLVEDQELLRSLGERARSAVRERFRLEQMVKRVEESLQATLASTGVRHASPGDPGGRW